MHFFWNRVKARASHRFSKGVVTVLAVFIVASTVSYAGSITPPIGTPVATFYTLTDIYDLINSNTTTTAGDHDFTFANSLAGSGHTLTQIYDALTGLISASRVLTGNTYLGVVGTYNAMNVHTTTVRSGISFGEGLTGIYPSASALLPGADASADLEASGGNFTTANGAVEWWHASGTRFTATLDFPTLSNVCSTDTSNNATGTLAASSTVIGVGNTVCGTAGALLSGLFNGSTTSFAGGAFGSGGIDDYNKGGPVLSDTYRANWIQCASGNNYCGTGDSGADAKDAFTGMVWSMPCNGTGCSSFSDASPLEYKWNTGGFWNNGRTASQLCSDRTGWFLPHQRQLMQAYVNGSYGTLETAGIGLSRGYWSGTTLSHDDTEAWSVGLSTGIPYLVAKGGDNFLRCVWGGS